MPQRRYGPTQGAGTAIIEREGEKVITPGALGVTVYTGVLEKGNEGELIYCPGKRDLEKKTGGYIPESFLPDCARDMLDAGEGAGELYLIRVQDTEQRKGFTFLKSSFDPNMTSVEGVAQVMMDSGGMFPSKSTIGEIAYVEAANAGKWSGRRLIFGYSIDPEEDNVIDGNQIDILGGNMVNGIGFGNDELKGATLYIEPVKGKSYEVVSNNGSICTLPIDVNLEADIIAAGGVPEYRTKLQVLVVLDNSKAVGIMTKTGAMDGFHWGAEVYYNGGKVNDWANLNTDLDAKYGYVNLINNDGSNTDIKVENLWNGSKTSPKALPSILSGRVFASGEMIGAGSSVFIQLNDIFMKHDFSDDDASDSFEGTPIDLWGQHPDGDPYKNQPGHFEFICFEKEPGDLRWNVVFTPEMYYRAMQNNKIGGDDPPNFFRPWQYLWEAEARSDGDSEEMEDWNVDPHQIIPPFVIEPPDEGTYTAGDTIELFIGGPAPGSLAGWFLVPNPLTAPNTKVRIANNTLVAIEVKSSVNLSEYWPDMNRTNTFMQPDPDLGGPMPSYNWNNFMETNSLVPNHEFQQVWGRVESAGDKNNFQMSFYDDAAYGPGQPPGNRLNVYTDLKDYFEGNPPAAQPLNPFLGDGEIYIVFENGDIMCIEFDADYVPAELANFAENWGWWFELGNGPYFKVEAPQEMCYAKDGHTNLNDNDYIEAAYDVDLTPLKNLFGKKKGLVKLATPGVTATAIQKAGVALADAMNYQYRYEVPSNIVTEDAAVSYIEDTLGKNDFAVVAFPSYGYVSDPEKEGLKLIPLTGAIHGREAGVARDYSGYHKPAAGVSVTLPRVLALPTGDRVLNEEFLNPKGVNIIKKYSGNFIIWGNRTLALDPTWMWKHQRELMSHYEHDLQESFDWIIFMLNNKDTWALAKTALKSYFLPEYTKGALDGDSFEKACSIKIDKDNNSRLESALGNLNASITLRLVDAVERFVISIGKAGIFEDTAS